jgi:hypothetical protein
VGRRRKELDSAIEGLYSVFNRYRLPNHCGGCPCCTSPADGQRLQAKPLRSLTAQDLERYARKALTTFGNEDDFRHFLPRLLEIAALEGAVADTEFEIVFGKIGYAHWESWPKAEQAAINTFLFAFWDHILGMFPSQPDARTALSGISRVVIDLTPYLDAWREDASFTAAQQLASLVEAELKSLARKGRALTPFCEQEAQQRQVLEWLIDPATTAWLERAFYQYSAAPGVEELSYANTHLVGLRSQWSPNGA